MKKRKGIKTEAVEKSREHEANRRIIATAAMNGILANTFALGSIAQKTLEGNYGKQFEVINYGMVCDCSVRIADALLEKLQVKA